MPAVTPIETPTSDDVRGFYERVWGRFGEEVIPQFQEAVPAKS